MSKIAALVFVIVGFTAACKKDQSATGADSKKAMGLYAQGFNALLDDPSRLIAGYFSAMPTGEPPDGRGPGLSDASFATSKLKDARTSFAAANEAAPESLKLGPAAEAAITSAEAAVALYETAYKYYQAESFKDDKGAKGKQLHAQLTAASTTFDAAMSTLGASMETIEDAQMTDEVAKYAGDKGYGYWFRFYTQQAKHVVLQVTRAHSAADLAKAVTAIKALAPHDQGLAGFVSSKGPKLSSTFKNYVDRASAFQAETAKLVRLIEAGKTLEDNDVSHAADSVIGAFNGLIQMGNALYQVEAVDNLKDE